MRCPSCKTEVEKGTWFCPVCAEQLETEVAAPPAEAGGAATTSGTFVDEVSRTVAWADAPEITAEALIVGDISEGAARTYHGAIAHEDGSTDAYRFYSSSDSTPFDDPLSVPVKTGVHATAKLTPYEDFVLDLIDGQRTLGEIQSSGLLAPAEIQVSLLTLEDRGLVAMAPPPGGAPIR